MGFSTANQEGTTAWQGGWTIFYWGEWSAWAQFVFQAPKRLKNEAKRKPRFRFAS